MSKALRGWIVGTVCSVLLVGVAQAGPGRTDGDPDRPQIMNPARPHLHAAVPEVSAREGSEVAAQLPAPDHWKTVLRAYLNLIRVFSR